MCPHVAAQQQTAPEAARGRQAQRSRQVREQAGALREQARVLREQARVLREQTQRLREQTRRERQKANQLRQEALVRRLEQERAQERQRQDAARVLSESHHPESLSPRDRSSAVQPQAQDMGDLQRLVPRDREPEVAVGREDETVIRPRPRPADAAAAAAPEALDQSALRPRVKTDNSIAVPPHRPRELDYNATLRPQRRPASPAPDLAPSPEPSPAPASPSPQPEVVRSAAPSTPPPPEPTQAASAAPSPAPSPSAADAPPDYASTEMYQIMKKWAEDPNVPVGAIRTFFGKYTQQKVAGGNFIDLTKPEDLTPGRDASGPSSRAAVGVAAGGVAKSALARGAMTGSFPLRVVEPESADDRRRRENAERAAAQVGQILSQRQKLERLYTTTDQRMTEMSARLAREARERGLRDEREGVPEDPNSTEARTLRVTNLGENLSNLGADLASDKTKGSFGRVTNTLKIVNNTQKAWKAWREKDYNTFASAIANNAIATTELIGKKVASGLTSVQSLHETYAKVWRARRDAQWAKEAGDEERYYKSMLAGYEASDEFAVRLGAAVFAAAGGGATLARIGAAALTTVKFKETGEKVAKIGKKVVEESASARELADKTLNRDGFVRSLAAEGVNFVHMAEPPEQPVPKGERVEVLRAQYERETRLHMKMLYGAGNGIGDDAWSVDPEDLKPLPEFQKPKVKEGQK